MNDVYAFIEAGKTTHPVTLLCRLLKVARSSFYAWTAGEQARAARRAADDALAHEITVLHIASRCTYGVPRIHAELRRLDRRVNRKRVERVTRERDLAGVTRRKRRSLTRPAKKAVPAHDLIGRDFTADARAGNWSGTSPTSPPTRAGWTWRPARSSDARWPTTTAHPWWPTHWRWPPVAATSSPAASCTRTAERSTPLTNFAGR